MENLFWCVIFLTRFFSGFITFSANFLNGVAFSFGASNFEGGSAVTGGGPSCI